MAFFEREPMKPISLLAPFLFFFSNLCSSAHIPPTKQSIALIQCISIAFTHKGDYKLRLASARFTWVDRSVFNFSSEYFIELIGISGKIYSGPCSAGVRLIDSPDTSSGTITAIVPCEENCIGYRFGKMKKNNKEILYEEKFNTDGKFDVKIDILKNGNINIRTNGSSSSIAIFYSEDAGITWKEINFVPNTSGFQIMNDWLQVRTKKEANQLQLLEVHASSGLQFIKKRYILKDDLMLEPVLTTPEIKNLNIRRDAKKNWAE